jgi:hypothetical protein
MKACLISVAVVLLVAAAGAAVFLFKVAVIAERKDEEGRE